MAAPDSVVKNPAADLVVERLFNAPRDRVFDAFTKPEHLKKWWGPKPADVGVAQFDARPGGKIFIGERYPDGSRVYLAGVVREIEPPSRLVFAIHFANESGARVSPPAHSSLGAAWAGEIVSHVSFSVEGRGTRVTIRTERSGVTAEWSDKARLGWGESLDKLDALLASLG